MRQVIAFVAASISIVSPSLAATEFVPASREIVFKAYRDGEEIGVHRVSFVVDGERIEARTEIELSVFIAFVRVFHYTHTAKEVWEGGRLKSLESVTYDDGEQMRVTAVDAGGIFTVAGHAFDGAIAGALIPTSYWNKRLVEQSKLLNTQTGAVLPVSIEQKGVEAIRARGEMVEALRYTLTAEFTLDLWYDTNGHWVKSRFDARGATIEYVLEPADTASGQQASLN